MFPLLRPLRARRLVLFTLPLFVACASGKAAREGLPEEEKVQTGYGSHHPRDVAGSVSSLSGEEIGRGKARSMADLLQRVPGLTVQRQGGGNFTVRIRGPRSFQGSEEPLVVVDGVAVMGGSGLSPLVLLHPSDVERIDVLKEEAASLYGSRGGNGVIVVTTKRAQ